MPFDATQFIKKANQKTNIEGLTFNFLTLKALESLAREFKVKHKDKVS